jgi:hypothetical protein
VAEQAERTLANVNIRDCSVMVARWPEHLPLIGAARTAEDTSATVVLDFGHSFVKRACARQQDGALTTLRLLPRVPARWTDLAGPTEPPIGDVRRLADFMVETMADTWRTARVTEPEVSSVVVASVASYVRDGQPLPRQGGAYPQLLRLSDDVGGWLSARLSEALDNPMTVRLLHDGTAAGHALAGQEHAAVITLGTALGVGFPPAAGSLRPLAPRFEVLGASLA